MAVLPALFGLLLAAFVSGQNVDITPREAVRRVGDEVTVLCKVAYPIDSCRMTVGKVSYRLLPSVQEGDVVYSGQGLEQGECGAHIRNVREEWNGLVECVLPPSTGSIEIVGKMALVVARAPSPPLLLAPPQPVFKEGDVLQAQCVVAGGRPAAKITWMLDDIQVVDGLHQPIITSEPGSDLKTISQNITRHLLADDGNRRLVCKAEHEAMDQPRFAQRQLQVIYPPKRTEPGPITIFGLKLGAEGRLNVTIRANPPPYVEWTVGDQRLTPLRVSEDGTITALEPEALGNGYYNCTLLLAHIAKEDVERTYYLKVTNDLGAEEFAVRLSTMDEPAGPPSSGSVELGTGAIVGIVIAVLVLLVAVFLIVFAKATDRWCFGAGRNRDQTKSSGESTPAGDVLLESRMQPTARPSDTESAVAGKERSRLAELTARVRAVLPKGKDKVQATEAAAGESEDKPLSDDKKNVVYAELALGEAARDKPPPETTEYAQIVYTTATETAKPAEENKDKET
ncbi:fasciclin-3 isoform X2 [Plutella xylostella]|uniref:fasciclin-3 isoform X2 n=1 Tax=Plutella xylostella TaxID=51655 RepID=UPI0020325845|nr:fasciclin-3 isoform X2 [Plutella xylostella]